MTLTGIDQSNAISFWLAVAQLVTQRLSKIQKKVQVAGTVHQDCTVEACFLLVLAPWKGEKGTVQGCLKQLLLQAGNDVDPNLHILPWATKSQKPAFRFDAKLLTTTDELQLYLSDATLSKAYKTVFVKAHLCLSTDSLEIMTGQNRQIADWADKKKIQIYKNSLDNAENPRMIGWLAYTGNFTDLDPLCGLITNTMQDQGETFEFRLKIKTMHDIPSGKKASDTHYQAGGNWLTFPWRAVHVEVDQPITKHTVSVFSQIFNDADTERPANMFVWFIPFPQYALLTPPMEEGQESLLQTSKCTYVQVLQNLCCLQMEDIAKLDVEVDGITLREFILQQRSDQTGKALFHSIDKSPSTSHQAGVHIVIVMKGHHNEPQTILNALPIICHCSNPNYQVWFVSDEVFDSDDYQYNNQTQAWTSKTDMQLRQMQTETQMHFILPAEMMHENEAAHPSELEQASFRNELN